MKLIPEWRNCLRMFSVQAMVLAGAVQGAWLALPREMVDSIPEPWLRGITVGLLVAGIAGRLVIQPKLEGESDA